MDQQECGHLRLYLIKLVNQMYKLPPKLAKWLLVVAKISLETHLQKPPNQSTGCIANNAKRK
jgi:hypothetical protein